MKFEQALQAARCLVLAVSGTNGKSTTSAMIERMLRHNGRRVLCCGPDTESVYLAAEQSHHLDFLLAQADLAHLSTTHFMRPVVAVLLNLAGNSREHQPDAAEYVRTYAPLFRDQQNFDWAIVQSEALARVRETGLSVPAKVITFSASDSSADLSVHRGLVVSRLANWAGPLIDLDHCLVRGPHNAENLMAALAVGHALRLPLEAMVDALKTLQAGPHRCELVAEINGVQFVNDSKACNIAATEKAIQASRPGHNGESNIWLIAGGRDTGADFHRLAPLVSRRLKGAFLIGETSGAIQSAWSLFTPCMQAPSLLEAVAEAARNATSGDVVLLSPACSGLDQFRNYQHRGQSFCEAVKSIGRGELALNPYMHGHVAHAW